MQRVDCEQLQTWMTTSKSASPASRVSMRNDVGILANTPRGLTPSPLTTTLLASKLGRIRVLNGLK